MLSETAETMSNRVHGLVDPKPLNVDPRKPQMIEVMEAAVRDRAGVKRFEEGIITGTRGI